MSKQPNKPKGRSVTVKTIAKAKTVKHRENTKDAEMNSKTVAIINLVVATYCLSAAFVTPFVIAIAIAIF